MKKFFALALGFLTVGQVISADAVKEIKAGLKQVIMYPDRAQLTREASVDIPAGKSILKLGGLSPYIDVQSIRVKGFGSFTILSVNLQNNYLQDLEEQPEIKKIRDQITGLQTKVEDEKAAISVLNEKQAFLVANRSVLVKETTFTLDQFKSLMDLYTASMDQVTTNILKKNRLIRDYEKEISSLQQQISDRIAKQKLPSGEISVTVTAGKPVTGTMTFSYVVSDAGWYPSYDIRVDDISKPVTIIYKANVFQSSGVSWKDVKLSFSNATPWISGNLPVLNPWFIDYYTPVQVLLQSKAAGVSVKRAVPEMAKTAADNTVPARMEEAAPVTVQRKVGETSVSFDVSVPYSIPADGKVQTIEIQRSITPALYKYFTVPKISPLAYLTANITDWAKLSLLSGEAFLYFENTFVGKTNLNVNQLADTLTFSLGTDNNILVKREKRKDYTSTRIIGANKTETNSFLITLRNNKAGPVAITLDDQVPVSSNSGISVDIIELSGGKYNHESGSVKWDIELQSQETKEIVLTYSVKYPKDKTIILE